MKIEKAYLSNIFQPLLLANIDSVRSLRTYTHLHITLHRKYNYVHVVGMGTSTFFVHVFENAERKLRTRKVTTREEIPVYSVFRASPVPRSLTPRVGLK